MKIVLSTLLALIAFAGNSVLCRLALGAETIDAASFTSIRLISGILVLLVILGLTRTVRTRDIGRASIGKGSWKAAAMLFLYAIAFSYGYISLDTGTGALVLFGAVQITMILSGVIAGNKLSRFEWLGVLGAFSGFVYLVLPEVTTPSVISFALMSISGIAWGFYTLAGRGSTDPLADTAYNFLRTGPLVIILLALTLNEANLSARGVWLAVLSGGVASGLGYTIWYSALRGLSSVQAAVVQLLVPVIAAAGGVLLMNEMLSWRLLVSSIMILGGIALVVLGKHISEKRRT